MFYIVVAIATGVLVLDAMARRRKRKLEELAFREVREVEIDDSAIIRTLRSKEWRERGQRLGEALQGVPQASKPVSPESVAVTSKKDWN